MAMALDRLLQKLQSQVPSLVSLALAVCGWLVAVAGLLPWWKAGTGHMLGLTCSIALFLTSFYRAVTTNPGAGAEWNSSVLRNGTDSHAPRAHCIICNADKFERVSHCRQCDRCVLRMDHHCGWIRNCVGYNNHKMFLTLVLWQCVASAHYLTIWGYTIHGCMHRKVGVGLWDVPRPNDGWLMWGGLLAMVAAADVLLTMSLLVFHITIIGHNVTTLECFYPSKKDESGGPGEAARLHAPPEGWSLVAKWRWLRAALHGRTWRFGNYTAVLGTDWWCWLLPTHPRRK